MKCSNAFQAELQLQNRMLDELRFAINAHGGEYSWRSDDDNKYRDNAPHVTSICDDIKEVIIRRIYIDTNNCIIVEAEPAKYEGYIEVEIENIIIPHIQHIIESIPPTEKVNDVSVCSTYFPVWNEDFLYFVQEMTSRAMPLFQKDFNFPRRDCFNIIRSWVCLFIYEHCETDWSKADIIKEIKKFINRELKQI